MCLPEALDSHYKVPESAEQCKVKFNCVYIFTHTHQILLVTSHINDFQTAFTVAQVNLLDENNHLGIPMMIFLPFSFSPPMASILTCQMYFPGKKLS